jgi:exonuclease III
VLTFLFWNINGQPILDRVVRVVERRGVDILLLAEIGAEETVVRAALTRAGLTNWTYPPVVASPRVSLFSRLPSGSVIEHFTTGNGRLSIREVRAPNQQPFLLAPVHLIAKAGGWTDHSQASAARGIADAIERVENQHGIFRTVLIGDLNMAPFAPGMIDGNAFHSFMTRDLADRRSERVVDGGRCRRPFFNPMWQFMTDRAGRPSGTYFWTQTVLDNHYWYTLDQVLVRPELADKLLHVEIVETDGERSLLTRSGRPDAETASDHLPILVILDL